MQWWRRMQHGTACLMRRTRTHKLSNGALWQFSCRFGHQAHPPESEQEHVSTDFRKRETRLRQNKANLHFKLSCRKIVPRCRYHWHRCWHHYICYWCEATGWCVHFHFFCLHMKRVMSLHMPKQGSIVKL
jgi:hypothetical protein